MKSAYERALERFGSDPVKSMSDEQKTQIAEVDSLYKSRIAQAELAAKQELQKLSGEPKQQLAVRQRLASDVASLKEKCEREKDKIRNANT